jgi:putative redox protein
MQRRVSFPALSHWLFESACVVSHVSWTGGLATRSGMGFVAETGSGHVLAMDGAPDAEKPENGGLNLAPRPLEMVLAGTGGCTA